MSNDPRVQALADCWRRNGDLFSTGEHAAKAWLDYYDAIRAYDAAQHAQTEHREEVVLHPRRNREVDKSAPPLVGGDPPIPGWYADAAEAAQAAFEEPSLTTWDNVVCAVLRVAVAHLTDDAVVEAAVQAEAKHRLEPDRGGMRAALAAAGKALLGNYGEL